MSDFGELVPDSSGEVKDLAKEARERLFDRNRIVGIPTGWPDFDGLIGGIKSGHCYILAADTGMGKSLFALNALVKMAKMGHKGCYFDLENGREQSLERVLRIWHNLNQDFFLDDRNKGRLDDLANQVENLRYYDLDELVKLFSTSEIYEGILKLIERRAELDDVNVFVIDPLQALETEQKSDQAMYARMGQIIREFKEIAQDLGVSVIVLHHLRKGQTSPNRWLENLEDVEPTKYRIPTLQDLKGTSKIGDFATDVWGLVRQKDAETPEERGKTLVRILKQRTGTSGGDVKFILREPDLTFELLSLDYSEIKGQLDKIKV